MLLALQATGTHALRLPTPRPEVLLAVRQRRRPDEGLSPAAGKRNRDRGNAGRPPVLTVNFTPRPHLETQLRDRPLNALLDTGSDISFANEHTARLAQTLGFPVTPDEGEVQLANGQTITLTGRVRLPIETAGKVIWHSFTIMPNLRSALLLGVDFWAQAGACYSRARHRETAQSDTRHRDGQGHRSAHPSRKREAPGVPRRRAPFVRADNRTDRPSRPPYTRKGWRRTD